MLKDDPREKGDWVEKANEKRINREPWKKGAKVESIKSMKKTNQRKRMIWNMMWTCMMV